MSFTPFILLLTQLCNQLYNIIILFLLLIIIIIIIIPLYTPIIYFHSKNPYLHSISSTSCNIDPHLDICDGNNLLRQQIPPIVVLPARSPLDNAITSGVFRRPH